jgi:hypothetical protein
MVLQVFVQKKEEKIRSEVTVNVVKPYTCHFDAFKVQEISVLDDEGMLKKKTIK